MNSQQIEINLKNLKETFDKETFIYELLVAYGISRTTVTRLKKGDFNLSKIEGEVLYKKKVLFKEVLSDNLLSIIDEITKNENALKHNPRFVIVTDYKTIVAKDTRTGATLDTPILEIDKHFHFFLPWAGQEKYQQKNDNHADRKASYEMAKLYDILVHENPNIYDDGGHNLNIFLSRLLFCFFAEDTDIFPIEGMFTETLAHHTAADGKDVAAFLDRLFLKLNTETDPNAPAFLQDFPYVNGGLFNTTIKSPKFSAKARTIILDCGNLDWSEINPDIFGSMIQAVVNPAYRSGLGMHYTSVPNIMKVIEPLFLNELYAEFEKSKGNDTKLKKLIYRLSKLKIFDPACGSGNFLIIAYKELRRLEIEIIKEINGTDNTIIDGSQSKIHFTQTGHQIVANTPQARINFNGKQTQMWLTEIKLSQFYGIELDDFAHEMAILSLWLAEHQMNKEFIDQLDGHGKAKPILPLKEAGQITQGNATRIDWQTACPKNKTDEIYILGNPPYLGARIQDKKQKEDMSIVFNNDYGYNNMDYIACWFYLGASYILNYNAKCAFVSTNSICQGEQVSLVWNTILSRNLEIDFAVQSFKWTNNAKANAGVSVVIVGLRNTSNHGKFLYVNNIKKNANNINSYLIDGSQIIVNKRNKPLSNLPEMIYGSMPNDGGFLLLSKEDFLKLIKGFKLNTDYIKKYIGAAEFINGIERYCLWLNKLNYLEASKIELIKNRINQVKKFREKSKRQATKKLAETPYQFGEIRHLNSDSILIPQTGSDRREYLPIGFLNSDYVISNAARVIYDAEPWIFGLISSKFHLIWVKAVSGRLKMDVQYSNTLSYNTFPFPEISLKTKENLNLHVYGILEERENTPRKPWHNCMTRIKCQKTSKKPTINWIWQ